ncbi:MAG: hypothetical protein K0U47_05890 [Epsilonproteobacteria bacterium]|nr:hypothetical protein [Campylobacterota bacterium]
MIKIKKVLATMLVGGMFSGLYAAGTLSGTTVTNSATLSFGDSAETAETLTSNTDSFVVDNMVDMTVVTLDEAAVQTKSGDIGTALKFKVKNEGNTVQDFALSAVKTTTTITLGSETLNDNFDATNVTVVLDNGDGVYDPVTDTATYIDELAPDAEAVVYIVADMPEEQENNDVAIYDLKAQVAQGGAPATEGSVIENDDSDQADNPLTVEIVFAEDASSVAGDGARDGIYLSADAFKIIIADMTIAKQSVVMSDPLGGANPKRIPGAVIRYCFTVTNNGGAAVAIANITDDLDESMYDVSLLQSNDVKIVDGDVFDCAVAAAGETNTGTVDNATGVVEIILDGGVDAGQTRNAYFNVTLK